MDAIDAIDEELRRLNVIRTTLVLKGLISGRSEVEDSIRLLETALANSVTERYRHIPFKYRIAVYKEGK